MRRFDEDEWKRLRDEAWTETCAAYHANPRPFYEAWRYLEDHPIFWDNGGFGCFERALWIEVAKVDPVTRCVEDGANRNTRTEIWLECGPTHLRCDAPDGYIERWGVTWDAYPDGAQSTHDYELNCGGKSFEKAITKLARKVAKRYGDDRSKVYEEKR